MRADFTVSWIGSTVPARQRCVMNLRHVVGMAQGHVMATIRNRRNTRSAHVDGHLSISRSHNSCRRAGRLSARACEALPPLLTITVPLGVYAEKGARCARGERGERGGEAGLLVCG